MYTRMAMLSLACICGAASSAFAQNIESDSILLPVFDEQDATFGTRITSRNEWLAIGADHEINGARGEGERDCCAIFGHGARTRRWNKCKGVRGCL